MSTVRRWRLASWDLCGWQSGVVLARRFAPQSAGNFWTFWLTLSAKLTAGTVVDTTVSLPFARLVRRSCCRAILPLDIYE
jgi:hypothetical protein